jgi:uncharacterized protein (DUF1697 family)
MPTRGNARPVTTLVALLRAINVTGTGVLKMEDLRTICSRLGFTDPRTYIASGNVVLGSKVSPAAAKAKLEQALLTTLGKPCRVIIREPAELVAIERAIPFPEAEPDRLLVLFLDDAPPKHALKDLKPPGGERLALKGREIFIHFPNGQGQSKLKIPFLDVGTGRNLNTVRALIAMTQ